MSKLKNKIFRLLYKFAMLFHDYSLENKIMAECPHDEELWVDEDLWPDVMCSRCGAMLENPNPRENTTWSHSKTHYISWNIVSQKE